MTHIDIDEATRNAILAALDERAERLEREVRRYQGAAEFPNNADWQTENFQRALVWNIAALHETNMARLLIGEAEPAPTLAEAVPWEAARPGMTYHDLQAR